MQVIWKRPPNAPDYSEFVADGDKGDGPGSDCTEARVDVESFPNNIRPMTIIGNSTATRSPSHRRRHHLRPQTLL